MSSPSHEESSDSGSPAPSKNQHKHLRSAHDLSLIVNDKRKRKPINKLALCTLARPLLPKRFSSQLI